MLSMSRSGQIKEKLLPLAEPEYAAFQRKLIPTVSPESILGVRTPALRSLARELEKDGSGEDFLKALPHRYFEENQLHAFLLSRERSYERCREKLDAFLPYVDNWATCDQMNPAVLGKEPEKAKKDALRWIDSGRLYAARFGIGVLMRYFLEDGYEKAFSDRVAAIGDGEYYLENMAAWYFATALAKRPEDILPYFTEHRLARETERKAIRKTIESFRVAREVKEILRGN